MDELAALRTFRSEIPERDAAARAAVRRALRKPKRRWRGWILAAAALAAVVAASSAFGWTSRLIDAIAGEPAPAPVKQAFELRNDARARQVMIFRGSAANDVIVERAHGVMALNTSMGRVFVWAAPTRGGGSCWMIEIERLRRADGAPNGPGSCQPTPLPAKIPLHYGVFGSRVGDRYLQLLEGQVSVGVASVELQYPDGSSETVAVFERFFLTELRGESPPTVLVARDSEGNVVERKDLDAGGRSSTLGPVGPEAIPKQTGPELVVIRVETSTGHPLTLSLAPAEDGQLCTIERFRGSRSGTCGPDRRRRVRDDELSVHPGLWNEAGDGKPLVKLEGVVGSAIAELELRYSDGTSTRIPIVERFVLFEIPPAHHDDARFTLIGRDRGGAEIARRVLK